ncbi:MAG: hypothetical protein AAGF14_00560 [Pseudomonadota bacterium]
MGRSDATVAKVMSLTLADFHRSVRTLVPDVVVRDGQTEFQIADMDGRVLIHYEPLKSTTLGGLLALPRARVTIHLEHLDKMRREAFLTRFDRAFQRGGG